MIYWQKYKIERKTKTKNRSKGTYLTVKNKGKSKITNRRKQTILVFIKIYKNIEEWNTKLKNNELNH